MTDIRSGRAGQDVPEMKPDAFTIYYPQGITLPEREAGEALAVKWAEWNRNATKSPTGAIAQTVQLAKYTLYLLSQYNMGRGQYDQLRLENEQIRRENDKLRGQVDETKKMGGWAHIGAAFKTWFS